jgi:hypothetical protein
LLIGSDDNVNDHNLEALIAGLPHPPKVDYVSGGHFVMTDVCPRALKSDVPALCNDAQGVDRAATQADIERKIAEFFVAISSGQ